MQLQAKIRNPQASPKRLIKQGEIPAELYGHKLKNLHLSVNANEFARVLRAAGESTLIELVAEDGSRHNVLIHDIQKHFLTSRPIHADFYEVSMTEKLRARVALEYIGESRAVRDLGGVLIKALNDLEVECLPADLPHSIPVEISVLAEFGQTIHVKDLKVSDKVKVLTSGEEVVAKVQEPRAAEVEAEKPLEDVSTVEGAAESPAATEGEAAAEPEKKPEKKAEKK